MVTIREVQTQDAELLVRLRATIDSETDYFLYGAGERNADTEKERERISKFQENNAVVLLAEVENIPAGYIFTHSFRSPRTRHTASLAVGVLKAYWGQGIATKLFEAMETWAREHGIRRIELEVMEHNTRAIELYEKIGFVREGIKQDAILINGKYINNIVMAKLLN